MELKPKPLAHWDSFNEYRESVTLYELGSIYMTAHEDVFTMGSRSLIKYWDTLESAENALDEIKRSWAEKRR